MLKVLAINALVLLAGLVGLEVGFGTWFSGDAALYRLTLPRNTTLQFHSSLPGQPAASTYTRDRNGLRGSYRRLDDIFILTVGGSTSDQRYISDGHTYQDRLAALFSDAGRPVDVVNAGVDGQSTFGHLAAFDHWLRRLPELKPRYILFYVGINDFYSLDKRAGYDRVARGTWSSLRRWLTEKSALLALVRVVLGEVSPAAVAHHHPGQGPESPGGWPLTQERRLQSYQSAVIDESLERLRARIAELAHRTRQLGAEPIMVTQRSVLWRSREGGIEGVREWLPDRFSEALADLGPITGVDRYHLERRQAEAIMAACHSAKGVCLDLASELEFDAATDFYDAFHTTPSGSDRIARYLFTKLSALR